jgi:HEAT repeat protein
LLTLRYAGAADEDELDRTEQALLALGERAAEPVVDSLLACLGSDRSAYVRLAALHSLEGVVDPRLLGALTQLAEHDADRGGASARLRHTVDAGGQRCP